MDLKFMIPWQFGATTLTITTFSVMPLRIKDLFVMLSITTLTLFRLSLWHILFIVVLIVAMTNAIRLCFVKLIVVAPTTPL
jgi:hypothetical protein